MRTLLNTLLLLPALALHAQSTELVTLRDEGNNVVNSTTITVPGAPTDFNLEAGILAELNGTSARTINVLRRELNVVPGSDNYFIWNEIMYVPQPSGSLPTFISVMPLTMEPEATSALFAYYGPNGTTGMACFRYVWYDEEAPTDSAWVNICFDTEATIGLEEVATNGIVLDVHPNPVSTGTAVSLAYRLGEAGSASAVFHNALGARAVVVPLTRSQDRATVPTTALRPGIWTVSVEQHGRVMATRRLVITQ